jgi:UDP-N-acetylglucosamine--N-acetylmuramyl-(pentapeptide) pyrophosphoryl-undecaprenol N-acetylglucosamine transferase
VTIVIAAAGTGGHVYPALAVADSLVGRGVEPSEIVFFGGDRLASVAVPKAGFPFVPFELPRLRRSWTLDNLRIPFALRKTAAAMTAEMDRRGATVVLGMSGYVTVPAAIAARRRGTPFFLQEQNASPGLASRFAGRSAVATFLGLPGVSQRLPRSTVVGNPLRRVFGGFDRPRLRPEAFERYSLDSDGPVLGVLGGSLGARILNESMPRIADALGSGSIVHLTGPEAFEDMTRRAANGPLPWHCRPYEDRMELFYAAADLVLCRAGAMTVSELAVTSTPAVFVPLEAVGQQANAEAMAATGGGVVVTQADAGGLPEVIDRLLGDPQTLAAMGTAAGGLHLGDAAGVIADAVLEAGRG